MLVFMMCLLIYVALGIPDGVLGSVWPAMSSDLGVDPGYLGIVSAICLTCSFISTLLYPMLVKRFSLSNIIIYSMVFVVIGFIFYMLTFNVILLILAAVFLGLGAGSIDAGVNEYAVRNFSVKQINVLHAFWAVGISIGTLISSYVFYINLSWHYTYLIIVVILLLILSLIIIKRKILKVDEHDETNNAKDNVEGGYLIFLFYFIYAIETVVGLYLSSYMFFKIGVSEDIAALMVFMFWTGLLFGRLFVMISSNYMSNKKIICTSIILTIVVSIVFLLSTNVVILLIFGFLIGFGFGPIYPTMLSQINTYYKDQNISKVISIQMIGALLGMVILPTIAGILFSNISYTLLFIFVIIFMIMLLVLLYLMERKYIK